VLLDAPGAQLPDATLAGLRSAGVEFVQAPLLHDRAAVSDTVADADVLVSEGVALDAQAFSQFRRVRFVLRPYVGYDDIDVQGASANGILVANVPDIFVEEVANHTLALILATNRQLLEADAFVRRALWARGRAPRQVLPRVRRLSALTLGLIGYGNIGRRVAERARPFGLRLLATDPYVSSAPDVQLVDLDTLLGESDIVSLHVLLSAETRRLIDARRLAVMRPGAVLINTSRGAVVDEPALVEALRSGHLAAAGLDVFEHEPVPADSPLLALRNVLLSPHLAAYSEEADVAHEARVRQILLDVARGQLPERTIVINKDVLDHIAAYNH
jgi:D-3-phosphoglycerate dehydrogenase